MFQTLILHPRMLKRILRYSDGILTKPSKIYIRHNKSLNDTYDNEFILLNMFTLVYLYFIFYFGIILWKILKKMK